MSPMLLSFIRSERCVLALSHKREMLAHQHLIGNVFHENTRDDTDMAYQARWSNLQR